MQTSRTLSPSSPARAGFTIIELLIVVAIIAIVAAMAIPKLQSARVSSDESAAIGTLRSLYAGQIQSSASGQIDSDGDGLAEYGYFGELSGAVPMRISAGGVPAAGVVGVDELAPSVLIAGLGAVQNSVVSRSGYIFQIYLPGPSVGGAIPGISEDATGGKLGGPFPDPDNCEAHFCAYAWPMVRGQTGNAVFFINEDGQLLRTTAGTLAYSGLGTAPTFDAAFTAANDMSSPVACNGLLAVDGNTWTVMP